MRFEQALAILAAFEREGVRSVLIGSMAMAAQGIIRATRDVDFFVAPDPANVERLKRALRAVFDDESIDDIGAADLAGPYPVIRYGPPEGDFVIDLVARIGDALQFDDIESEELVIEGVRVRVATPLMLYRMKRATVTPQNRVDAANLRSSFGLVEGGVMPVQKMRHIAEATTLHAAPLRAENLRSAFDLSEVCLRLSRCDTPRGVRRFTSIEAAQDRDAPRASGGP